MSSGKPTSNPSPSAAGNATAEDLVDLARQHMQQKQYDEAWKCLEDSLAVKRTAPALRNLGNICQLRGETVRAISYFKDALKADAGDHASLAMLGEVYFSANDIEAALLHSARAIQMNPAEIRYKERFAAFAPSAASAPLTRYDAAFETALLACLNTPELDCGPLQAVWFQTFTQHPDYRPLFRLSQGKASPGGGLLRGMAGYLGLKADEPPPSFDRDHFDRAWSGSAAGLKSLQKPFFLQAVQTFAVYTMAFEEFLIHLRRRMLEESSAATGGSKFSPAETAALAAAIACYCFYTEYIFDSTPEEEAAAANLRRLVETGAGTPAQIALSGCYAPLHRLANAADIGKSFAADPILANLIRLHLTEQAELERDKAAVTSITPIDDALSVRVREQYEEFPYPRWKTLPKNLIPAQAAAPLKGRPVKILNAGCGTGSEAAQVATLFPDASILAVDLSRASLAYATRRAAERGIANITFRHGDLLRLGEVLKPEYDCIFSSGVLVCVDDPLSAWRGLCGLLKPGGLMCIGLYSKIARRHIIKVQEIIKKGGYPGTTEGMKAFRKKSPALLEPALLRNVMHTEDYYHLSMYRDMLFHVKEHCFDIPQIRGMLSQLGLEFLQFQLRSSAPYLKAYPDDPEGRNLDNWHAFEMRNPDFFIGMYQFWCRKKT